MRGSGKQARSKFSQAEPDTQQALSQGGQFHRLREDIAGAPHNFLEDGRVGVCHDFGLNSGSTVEVAEEMVG